MNIIQASNQNFDPDLHFGVKAIKSISYNEHCPADASAAILVSMLRSLTELSYKVFDELTEKKIPYIMKPASADAYCDAIEVINESIKSLSDQVSWEVSAPCYVEFHDVSNEFLKSIQRFEKFVVPVSKNTPNKETLKAINDPYSEKVDNFGTWLDEID